MSRERASDFALLRSAEVALENGKNKSFKDNLRAKGLKPWEENLGSHFLGSEQLVFQGQNVVSHVKLAYH